MMTPHPFLNRNPRRPLPPPSPLTFSSLPPIALVGILESRLRRRFKGSGSLSRAKTGIMTSHFGIVVVDGNKRGEDEALTEEEKRQMYAPDAACVFRRSHGQLMIAVDALTLKRGWSSMPVMSAPPCRFQCHAPCFCDRCPCLTFSSGRLAYVG